MNNSAPNDIDFSRRMFALGAEFSLKIGDCWSMVSPQSGLLPEMYDAAEYKEDPTALGGKRSFVPILGDIVWELPQPLANHVPFSAYICQVSDSQQIGYARVPHYNFNEYVVNAFADEVIARFESTTAAMVFNQVDNPGGSMFRMYAILSTLTDRPLDLPKHIITISEDDKTNASKIVALAEAGEVVPLDERPSPELVAYSRFVLSEVKEGRGTKEKPSKPVYLMGVEKILPAKNHYTKKIVVLINNTTFSAPEFLAAILQDNKRAILFGTRTAGAGGCVKRFYWPQPNPWTNPFFLDSISLRWTLGLRTNGEVIEKIGVQPEVKYHKTAEDLMGGYAGYRQALLATISAYINENLR